MDSQRLCKSTSHLVVRRSHRYRQTFAKSWKSTSPTNTGSIAAHIVGTYADIPYECNPRPNCTSCKVSAAVLRSMHPTSLCTDQTKSWVYQIFPCGSSCRISGSQHPSSRSSLHHSPQSPVNQLVSVSSKHYIHRYPYRISRKSSLLRLSTCRITALEHVCDPTQNSFHSGTSSYPP